MRRMLWLVVAGMALAGAQAQAQEASKNTVDCGWPGLHYEAFAVQRIDASRIVVGVRLVAGPKSAPEGTLLGKAPRPPDPNASPGTPDPQPTLFSLQDAVVTDRASHETYPAVPAKADGPRYFPSEVYRLLKPGESCVLSVQFEYPAPDPATGARKTFLLQLPEAKTPLSLGNVSQ